MPTSISLPCLMVKYLDPVGNISLIGTRAIRTSLQQHSTLFTIIEPLGPQPGEDASQLSMMFLVLDGTITPLLET
jgi:hypothetical protein